METNIHIQKYKSYPRDNVDNRITYLAGPYSHKDPEIQEERVAKLKEAALILTRRGLNVFSPVNYTHIFESSDCEPRFGYYHFCMAYVKAIAAMNGNMIVYKLDGWDTSFGVGEELREADRLGMSVKYFNEADLLDGNLGSFIKGGIDLTMNPEKQTATEAVERLKADIEKVRPEENPGGLGAVLEEGFQTQVLAFVEAALQTYRLSKENEKIYFESSTDFVCAHINKIGLALPMNPTNLQSYLSYGNPSNGAIGDLAIFNDWIGIVVDITKVVDAPENIKLEILRQKSDSIGFVQLSPDELVTSKLICFRSLV